MSDMPGIYPALVVNNDDPEKLGRIRVEIPALPLSGQPWALACVSPSTIHDRTKFVAPEPQSEVWIMFQEADARRPVWIGCAWNVAS